MAGPTGLYCNDDKSVCIEITYANESKGHLKGTLKENGFHYPVNGGYSHDNTGANTVVYFETENSGVINNWNGNIDRNSYKYLQVWRGLTFEDG
jgi:hypothetical protein